MKFRVIELFAGVGGFRVGMNNVKNFNPKTGKAIEDEKWDFVWANQWEPSTKIQPAYECYIKRFGSENVSNEDISKVNHKDIPDHDLLVGGFPCQDYSVARSITTESGIKGKKGVLWWEIVKIAKNKKPKALLLENVDRLLKSPAKQRGRDFAVMLRSLDRLGYTVQWRVINPGLYNMPQRRKRIFILATRNDLSYTESLRNIKDYKKFLEEGNIFNKVFKINEIKKDVIIKELDNYKDEVEITNKYSEGKFLMTGIYVNGKVYDSDIKEFKSENEYTLEKVIKEGSKFGYNLEDYVVSNKTTTKFYELKGKKKIERINPIGEKYFYSEGRMTFPDRIDKPGRTMLTSEGTTNRSSHILFYKEEKDKIYYRTLTEVEAEILQMFPPNWTNTGMTKRQRFFMMGNALVTGVISSLESEIRDILSNKQTPQ